VELTNRTTLHFRPVTQITGLDVYELKGLEVACMSGDVCIVVLLDDTMPQVSVIGDIDLTAEHK
jgi:hypothetical protein